MTSRKINHIIITLTPLDLYHVQFFYVRGVTITPMGDFDNVYADQLVSLFCDTTGLALIMPVIIIQ